MLEKISNDGRVETMCNTISVFLMAFVVFYMSYSNRFFLRRRTKELGIYALLGYRKSTILSLLTTENLLTCTGAFIAGILLGSFFHKGIVFGITKLLDLAVNNSEIPFFNPNAIMKTACFIFTVIIVLALSNSRFLFKTSLMDLVRYEKSAEKKMKFHAVLSVIGFLAVISGYSLALDILRGSESLWITVGFYPVAMPTFCTHTFRNSAFYCILSSFCGTGRKEKQTKILHRNKDHHCACIYIPYPFKLQDADHAHIIVSCSIDSFKRYGFVVILSNSCGIPYGTIGNRMQDRN